MTAQDIRICAMKVVVKEILNDDKTLKETVTKIVGYWPFYFGRHPYYPNDPFEGLISPFDGRVPDNAALPQTREESERIVKGGGYGQL